MSTSKAYTSTSPVPQSPATASTGDFLSPLLVEDFDDDDVQTIFASTVETPSSSISAASGAKCVPRRGSWRGWCGRFDRLSVDTSPTASGSTATESPPDSPMGLYAALDWPATEPPRAYSEASTSVSPRDQPVTTHVLAGPPSEMALLAKFAKLPGYSGDDTKVDTAEKEDADEVAVCIQVESEKVAVTLDAVPVAEPDVCRHWTSRNLLRKHDDSEGLEKAECLTQDASWKHARARTNGMASSWAAFGA